ncbi:SMC-Scp complex subunit ScpB [Shewanella sp.]|uniref:SMC-Scp complex subunit ScpB n=1 Tax=Shewanella sp. TaxID=50422 RepID=UPI0040474896
MNQINAIQLKQLIEASLFVLGKPLSIKGLKETVLADFSVSRTRIQDAIDELQLDYQDRGVQLVKVASGYRFQTQELLSPFLQPLWQEKAPKYSRATLETLAVIAYRQPVTRGDIEHIRGVAISSHIIKNLSDRHWIKAVGHKEVPGRPALYATTHQFLDYFGLNKLADLPALTDAASLQALFDKASIVLDEDEVVEDDSHNKDN